MRVMVDANVLLDCLILEESGVPRAGKAASDLVLNLCDQGIHSGLVAWHTLPIVAYYHGRRNPAEETTLMIDSLLKMLEVPTVGHREALNWRCWGIADFEDALQIASAIAGLADVFITRNTTDFPGCVIPVMTPEEFIVSHG